MTKLPTEDDIRATPRIVPSGGVASYGVARREPVQQDSLKAKGLTLLADALGKTEQQLYVMQVKEQERADYFRSEEAFNQLRATQIDLSVGEENGFTKKRGGDAVNQPMLKQWTERFDERAKQIEETLGNDEQRERFRRRTGVARAQFQGNILEHVSREQDTWAKNVYQTTLDTETKNIGLTPQDDMAVGMSMQRVGVAAETEAQRLGLDPAVAKTKATDALWVARLEAWRLKDPVGALRNFQENQQTLTPDVRVKVAEGLYRDAEPVLAAQLNSMGEAQRFREKLLTMGPEDVMNIKTGHEVVDALPADQKLRVLQRAYTLAGQQFAQERQALELRYRDAEAAYERGLAAPNPPSRNELMRAFGPERGQRLAGDLDRARAFGGDVRRVQSLSASDQAALLLARQPPAGEGFADAIRRWDSLKAAVDRVTKEREQDPARAVLQNAPQVQSTYKEFVNRLATGAPDSPAAAQAYAAATLAEQQRLQVVNPQVLTKDMADSIGKQFATPPKEGENVSNIMRGMVEQWGRYWPLVGKQLGKQIPPEATVIGLGIKPEAEAILAEASKLKPEQLRQGIAEADIKDMRERIRRQYEPLQLSLTWQTGGIETYDNYVDSAEKISTALMQKGVKMKDAVDRAFEGTVGFKYEFEDTWRVPKTEIGGATNMTALRDGAFAAVRDIAEEKPMFTRAGRPVIYNKDGTVSTEKTITIESAGRHFLIPTLVAGKERSEDEAVRLWRAGTNRAVGEFASAEEAERAAVARSQRIGEELGNRLAVPRHDPAVRPADAERQWREDIRANGFWVTSPGDGGLTLYVKSQMAAVPVLDAGGAPVRRTWQELSTVGNSVRAAYMKDIGVRRP